MGGRLSGTTIPPRGAGECLIIALVGARNGPYERGIGGQGKVQCIIRHHMVAPEIFTQRDWVLGADLLPNEPPALSEALPRPCKLEVIHVDNQKQPQSWMDVARPPRRDLREAPCNEVLVAVALPVPPRIRVPI